VRWSVFILFAYLALALELGLVNLLAITGPGGAAPRFTLVLVALVALRADVRHAVPAAMVLGACVDLAEPFGGAQVLRDTVALGPAVLGYGLAAYVGLQCREIVFRDSAIALAAVVLVAGLFAELVIVALLTLRGLPVAGGEAIPGWDAFDQLAGRLADLFYTTVLAAPLGWGLHRTGRLWGWPDTRKRRVG